MSAEITGGTGPRSEVREQGAFRGGNGTSRSWSRTIRGTLYGFTAVVMPDGEHRYFVRKFNGYVGGPSWDCAWDVAASWTVRPAVANADEVVPGDFVTLESTVGYGCGAPVTRTVFGIATLDDEGTLRVGGVNVTKDADGYFPCGVLVLSISPWRYL